MRIHSKTPPKIHSTTQGTTPRNTPRNIRASMNPMSFVILVIGLIAFVSSCAPPPVSVETPALTGPSAPGTVSNLSIRDSNIEQDSFVIKWNTPVNTGTKPDGSKVDLLALDYLIYYLEESREYEEPVTAEYIRQNSVVQSHTVKGVSQARVTELKAYTRYLITVASYNSFARLETMSSEVLDIETGVPTEIKSVLSTRSYHSTEASMTPEGLGSALRDSGPFALTDGMSIVTVTDMNYDEYTIHFGSAPDNYSESYQKAPSGGLLQISKSDLTTNSFSFVDGAVIGISGPDVEGIVLIAMYHPLNIYGSQDLQAIRMDLGQDYTLKKNVEFPPTNAGTSNYEVVGDDSNPFTGRLSGAGYTITGLQIESSGDFQGLFGTIEVDAADTVAVQNIVLRNFKVTGNAYVGALSGWMKRGTIDSVNVEASDANAGKIEVSGSIAIDGINRGYGGGLFGRVGTGATGTQVRIQNTSSGVAVLGTGTESNRIGGLAGEINKDSIVAGYASGDVSGMSSVGGLVGYLDTDSTVAGYASGDVSGISSVGGLVGYLDTNSTVSGYASGDVSGTSSVGGLVGTNNGSASGYARSVVRRSSGTEISIKKTVGENIGTSATYSSTFESQLYEGDTGIVSLIGISGDSGGDNGISVPFNSQTTQSTFDELVFGTELGEWTWVANDRWPAINIGDTKPADEQALEICIFSPSVDRCRLAANLRVDSYYGTEADVFPIGLGQAIADSGMFAMANDVAVVTIVGLADGEYTIYFGPAINDYSGGSYQKTATSGILTILKSELATNAFSFVDRAVIGISGLSVADTQHIATYVPSNIYNHQDLQAMRKDLDRDYELDRDIDFYSVNEGTSSITNNYETVGNESTPFTGTLNGAGHAIRGLETSTSNDYQGLFGVMEADTVDTVVAQDLVFYNFKVTGNAAVGSLAGWIKRGTVMDVYIEVSDAKAGKIEVSGDIAIGGIKYGYGGGLLGRAGTGAADMQVRMRNIHSVIAVSGTGTDSNRIGGLIGETGSDVDLTEIYVEGKVTGDDYIGGLVGYNSGTVSGRGRGNVREHVTGGSNSVGGLAGYNSGTVVGLVTGSMKGYDQVGGLAGSNTGTVIGYMAGFFVTGTNQVGGLVGFNNGGKVAGYSIRAVAGFSQVGGMVGRSTGGIVEGYARDIVRRLGGTAQSFGKTIGSRSGGVTDATRHADYHSLLYGPAVLSSEEEIVNVDGVIVTEIVTRWRNTEFEGPHTGSDGREIYVYRFYKYEFDVIRSTIFPYPVLTPGLDFGEEIGQWTWVVKYDYDGYTEEHSGHLWPAINIGDYLKLAREQPLVRQANR